MLSMNKDLNIKFTYIYKKTPIEFITKIGVQSAKRLDEASQLLLDKILLTGCNSVFIANGGYGSFAIPLAKVYENTSFDITDRDFVNIYLTRENIKYNNLKNCITYLSDGVEHAKKSLYETIILNYNNNYGKEWLQNFLLQSNKLLEPEKGKIYLCVHRSIKEFAKSQILNVFYSYKKIHHTKNFYLLSN